VISKVNRLEVGDWVYYAGDDEPQLDGALGYIDRIVDTYCAVEFIRDQKGKRLKWRKQCSIKELIPAKTQSLTKGEFDYLMDLALKTKDYEWCKQLVEQFEGQKKQSTLYQETR
jgi:hypothetical protein